MRCLVLSLLLQFSPSTGERKQTDPPPIRPYPPTQSKYPPSHPPPPPSSLPPSRLARLIPSIPPPLPLNTAIHTRPHSIVVSPPPLSLPSSLNPKASTPPKTIHFLTFLLVYCFRNRTLRRAGQAINDRVHRALGIAQPPPPPSPSSTSPPPRRHLQRQYSSRDLRLRPPCDPTVQRSSSRRRPPQGRGTGGGASGELSSIEEELSGVAVMGRGVGGGARRDRCGYVQRRLFFFRSLFIYIYFT